MTARYQHKREQIDNATIVMVGLGLIHLQSITYLGANEEEKEQKREIAKERINERIEGREMKVIRGGKILVYRPGQVPYNTARSITSSHQRDP